MSHEKTKKTLSRFDNINANKDPDIYVFPEGMGFGQQLYFYKHEKDKAVKIAEKRLKYLSKSQRKELEELLFCYFELWKIEYGIPPHVNAGTSLFSQLLGVNHIDDFEEEERFNIIKDLQAWETSPYYQSPISLIRHIYSSNFNEPSGDNYLGLIAVSLLVSDEQKNKKFWPEMINTGLLLAELEITTLDRFSKNLWKKLSESSKKKTQRTRGLIEQNEVSKIIAEDRSNSVHSIADRYLSEGRKKSEVVGLIKNYGGFNVSERQIRRYLETHSSGHWKPKKKK